MSYRASLMLLLAAVLAVTAIARSADASTKPGSSGSQTEKLYRWVDDKGVVHYGDSIPPEYSKQQRDVLNKQGVQIGTMEAEKTPAQVAEDLRKREALRQSLARDEILLRTYISAEQIEQLRDQRLDLIEGQIKVTAQYLRSRRTRLGELHTQSSIFRPYSTSANARQMPDQLAEELVRTLNDIKVQEESLVTKRAEQQALREQFHSDIERFKELKAAQAVTRTQ
ncbi:MAG TPA: DUF4124 domain-containing protein [Steroidobacteraceae bacterium]|nr:DUF4124 domain-containing protein [Steroidobacteraceae bacterium]